VCACGRPLNAQRLQDKVGSKADKESNSLQSIQKMKVGVVDFMGNLPLQKIFKQKLLGWMGLTPEETKEVMDFEKQNPMPMLPPEAPPNGPPGAPPGIKKDLSHPLESLR
jgi:hypothetical protein